MEPDVPIILKEKKRYDFSKLIKQYQSGEWSETNSVAIIAKSNLHILEADFNFKNEGKICKVTRGLIRAPCANDDSFWDVKIDYNELMNGLSDEDKFELQAFMSLTPVFKWRNQNSGIMQVGFSNRKLNPKACVLAVLNSGYQMELWVKDSFGWERAINLSMVWRELCLNEWLKLPPRPLQAALAVLKQRVDDLRIVAFVWVDKPDSETASNVGTLLFTVHRNRKLLQWHVFKENSVFRVDMLNKSFLQFHPDTRIDSLHWMNVDAENGWLFVTTARGTIHLFKFSFVGALNYFAQKENIQIIYPKRDGILVRNMRTKICVNGSVLFVFLKRSCLFVEVLSSRGRVLHTNSRNFDCTAAIVCAEILKDNKILFITSEKGVHSLRLFYTANGNLSFRRNKQKHSFKDVDKRYKCYGGFFSRNRNMCFMLYSRTHKFDHLDSRRPSHASLCTLTSRPTLKMWPDQRILEGTAMYQFHDMFGVTRYLRSIPAIIPGVINTINMSFENEADRLRGRYWVERFCHSNPSAEIIEHLEMLEKTALFTKLAEMMRSGKLKKDRMFFVNKYLQDNYGDPSLTPIPLRTFAGVAFDVDSDFVELSKHCLICFGNIMTNDFHHVECQYGHKVRRCVATLQPVYTMQTLNCRSCNAICLANLGLENCVMCDGKLGEY